MGFRSRVLGFKLGFQGLGFWGSYFTGLPVAVERLSQDFDKVCWRFSVRLFYRVYWVPLDGGSARGFI